MFITHLSPTVAVSATGAFVAEINSYINSTQQNQDLTEGTKRTYLVRRGQVMRYIIANGYGFDGPEAWDENRLRHMVAFMRDHFGFSSQTICKAQSIVTNTLTECRFKGMIERLPKPAKIKHKTPVIQFLTPEELEILRTWKFSQRLTKIRDLFLIQCYSGVSYCDIPRLKKNYVTHIDGIPVIQALRRKTESRPFTVPLVPMLFEILSRYNWNLPKISNQKYNAYLKEIAAITGIEKSLKTHDARRTCGMYYLRITGSLDATAAVLGHTTTDITRKFYAPYLPTHLIAELKRTEIFKPVLAALAPAAETKPVTQTIEHAQEATPLLYYTTSTNTVAFAWEWKTKTNVQSESSNGTNG